MPDSKFLQVLLDFHNLGTDLFVLRVGFNPITMEEVDLRTSEAKRIEEEIRAKRFKLIADNREMLVKELQSEIKTIEGFGGLQNLPDEIRNGEGHFRISLANWVIVSKSFLS